MRNCRKSDQNLNMLTAISKGQRGCVTTILEHPSAFDAMTYYSKKHGCELRVAGASTVTGGVDVETIISLIDTNTAILCCMAASNISGHIYDIEKIFEGAREINPDIYIVCDAVQHAPHGVLDPEMLGIDAMIWFSSEKNCRPEGLPGEGSSLAKATLPSRNCL